MDNLERDLAALLRQREIIRARERMLPFMKLIQPDPDDPENAEASQYVETPLARLLCQVIEKVDAGTEKRVCVSVGPQMGKSQVLSRGGPAWLSGRRPTRHMILGSYNDTFAQEFGGEVRAIMRTPAYSQIFPKHGLQKGSESKNLLITNKNGKMAFVGVGGSGTGKPADIFFVDDPIKSDEDAASEIFREKLWTWFNRTVFSRCHNDSAVIVVHCMTGDTPVTMADGSCKRLEAVRPGDEVRAYSGGRHVNRKVLNWASQGEDDVFEIRTGNHRVRANARHPFLVETADGSRVWRKVSELSVGDTLVSSAVEPGESPARITELEAWFLGFMFGDGWLTQRDTVQKGYKGRAYPRRGYVTCCAWSVYEELNRRVLAAFQILFGLQPKATRFGYWRTEKQLVGKWLAEHGLNGSAKTKALPPWLFGQPVSIRRAFVTGFSEADGCVSEKGRVSVAAANESLTRDLRALARSAGFAVTNLYHFKHRSIQPPNSPQPIEADIWQFRWRKEVYETAFSTSKIRSIAPVGRAEVFDIQVEDAECFLADGLVSHNTRWHEDDLIGRLVDPTHPERNKKFKGIADQWKYYNLPAVVEDPDLAEALDLTLAEPTDPVVIEQFGRKPMVSLWEKRKGLRFLAEAKQMDAAGFGALYMGQPTPPDGDYFTLKDIVEYDRPSDIPAHIRWYCASDHATGEKQRNDYSVLGAFGVDENDDIWIAPDFIMERMKTDVIVDEMMTLMTAKKPLVWWMEDELISKSFGPFLLKRMHEEEVYTTLEGVSPGRNDLEHRARAIQGRMRMGKVHFPNFHPKWAEAKSQLLKFPKATHDDFVSFLAIIGLGLAKTIKATVPKRDRDNVIRPGSLTWIMNSAKVRARKEERVAAAKGW